MPHTTDSKREWNGSSGMFIRKLGLQHTTDLCWRILVDRGLVRCLSLWWETATLWNASVFFAREAYSLCEYLQLFINSMIMLDNSPIYYWSYCEWKCPTRLLELLTFGFGSAVTVSLNLWLSEWCRHLCTITTPDGAETVKEKVIWPEIRMPKLWTQFKIYCLE